MVNMQLILSLIINAAVLAWIVREIIREWRNPSPRKVRRPDGAIARVTAVLATLPLIGSLLLINDACLSKGDACMSSGNDAWMLVFFTAFPFAWALPKLWRWFGPGRQA